MDLNEYVNAFDATIIHRYLESIDMGDPLFSMNSLDRRWKFVDRSQSEIGIIYDITNLMGDNKILIHGIKLGDVNGNWGVGRNK